MSKPKRAPWTFPFRTRSDRKIFAANKILRTQGLFLSNSFMLNIFGQITFRIRNEQSAVFKVRSLSTFFAFVLISRILKWQVFCLSVEDFLLKTQELIKQLKIHSLKYWKLCWFQWFHHNSWPTWIGPRTLPKKCFQLSLIGCDGKGIENFLAIQNASLTFTCSNLQLGPTDRANHLIDRRSITDQHCRRNSLTLTSHQLIFMPHAIIIVTINIYSPTATWWHHFGTISFPLRSH